MIILLPAIVGAAVIYFVYRVVKWSETKYPCHVLSLRIIGFVLVVLVVIGVVATYCYSHAHRGSEGANLVVAQVVQRPTETVVSRKLNFQTAFTRSITGAVEVSSKTSEIFSCEIIAGSQVLLEDDAVLYIASTTNSRPADSSELKRLSRGTVVVVEAVGLSDIWYFVKTYRVFQKNPFETCWEELGSGWLDVRKCRERNTFFSGTLDAEFLPIGVDELKEAISCANIEGNLRFPNRSNVSNRMNFIDTALHRYKGKRVSWADPILGRVSSDGPNGQLMCTATCSGLSFSFPVSDQFASALKFNKDFYCSKVLRIEGVVKFAEHIGHNLYLLDVIVIGTFELGVQSRLTTVINGSTDSLIK